MGSIIGGVSNVAGSLIGRGARRAEAKSAAADFAAQRQALMDTEFTNVYAGLENVAEDLSLIHI